MSEPKRRRLFSTISKQSKSRLIKRACRSHEKGNAFRDSQKVPPQELLDDTTEPQPEGPIEVQPEGPIEVQPEGPIEEPETVVGNDPSALTVPGSPLPVNSFTLEQEKDLEKQVDENKCNIQEKDVQNNYEDRDEWWNENSESEDDEGTDTNNFFKEKANQNEPLYTGAPLTVAESLYAVLVLALRHSLTGECLVDILVLISLHCLVPNLCHTTLYKFKKFFSGISAPLKYHYYCNICYGFLPDKKDCPGCTEKLGRNTGSSYFIEISILSQLKNMFLRQSFYNDLQFRFKRVKKCNDNIEDIFDGEIYKSLSADGFSDSPNNITFMWYTDGIPVFKSSKFAIWPMYLVINELPYKKRVSKENMIVAGVWCGSEKPSVNRFLTPLFTSLTELSRGVEIAVPGKAEPINVKGKLICGTCDLPAKSHFLNMTQFNGNYGCPNCKQAGKSVKTLTDTNVYVYPFDNLNKDGPLRTDEESANFAKDAVKSKKAIFGIKGPSMLHYICKNYVTGVAIDIMHGVFLGICRKLVYLWFDVKLRNQEFSLYNQLNVIEKRLLTIRPPSFVQRVPRSIKECLKFWKAQEFKYFLMCYSIPVLYGVMSRLYMLHHIELVSAMFLLSQRSISIDNINTARNMLFNYVSTFQDIYGEQFMSVNVHQLLHLPTAVLRLGPLWVTTCFPFEDFNGAIMKLVHGTQHVDLQIGSSVSSLVFAPLLSQNMKKDSSISFFLKAMSFKGKSVKVIEAINNYIMTVGKYTYLESIPIHIKQALIHSTTNDFGKCWIFYKIKIKDIIYGSKSYTRIARHNSYTVSFLYNETLCYGQITCFVKQKLCRCLVKSNCNCRAYFFAIINKLSVKHNNIYSLIPQNIPNYLLPVEFLKRPLAVPVHQILQQLFFISIDSGLYIVQTANNLEAE